MEIYATFKGRPEPIKYTTDVYNILITDPALIQIQDKDGKIIYKAKAGKEKLC